jgi:hypothetical protein
MSASSPVGAPPPSTPGNEWAVRAYQEVQFPCAHCLNKFPPGKRVRRGKLCPKCLGNRDALLRRRQVDIVRRKTPHPPTTIDKRSLPTIVDLKFRIEEALSRLAPQPDFTDADVQRALIDLRGTSQQLVDELDAALRRPIVMWELERRLWIPPAKHKA